MSARAQFPAAGGAGSRIDAVVIGRNEGARLLACLKALSGQVRRVVYVDSGSTDGSADAARAAGAEVVTLDPTQPFTAARARNAGLQRLADDPPELVQFIDGDCELREGWIDTAIAFLDATPRAAVVCGRRRERFPEASAYNALCDAEWDTPLGPALACGGDALMRYDPLAAQRGYRAELIAGEEPELCLRLRAAGWQVWRIDAEMTLHDAAMTRFAQWWRRSERAGYSFAEAATRFTDNGRPFRLREYRRALGWGLMLPLAVLLATLALHPGALALLLAYPVQVIRLAPRLGWLAAFFNTLGKLPESLGALRFHWRRMMGKQPRLIEYK
ncbi:MAG: glycosyltransferase family 2 protein [Pararhodobacter sp.]